VRPRSAHRKRRSLFLFLARPGSSMGGLRPSRTPRPINQAAPLPPGRPPAGASGAPAGVLCTGEGAEGACRNSLASSKPSSTCHPVIYLLLPSFFCSCWARMVPSAEFRFSFSHARPVDCRPCRQPVRAWLQQETTVLAGFKFGSRTIKLKRLVLQLGRCIHVRNRGRPFG